MKLTFSSAAAIAALVLPSFVAAQLNGTVGPTTTTAEKAAVKVCSVLDYGGVASKTSDIGPPLASAWADCIDGGEVYIPSGDYGFATWVALTGGTGVSIRLDGILYRTGQVKFIINDTGNMIEVEHTTDFEFFSSDASGAIQGYGYVFLSQDTYGPRILRLHEVVDFSVHDLAFVDSPAFHFTMDTCENGEAYNMIIRGANEGGLDGIDIFSTNIWVHDVEVTNKDECVTVKSPSSYILIEQIYCNWSGGCAIGSLANGTDIHHVTYDNVYTQNANQMMLIKSNGGSGSLYNCTFSNFIGHTNAYTLDIDGYWSSETTADGDGVQYYNLTFDHWSGTAANGSVRAPIQVLCPAGAPCYDITISDFYVWTEEGDSIIYKMENAYGTGAGLETATDSSYTSYGITTQTITTVSSASYAITTMAADLTVGFPITASIPIPTVPTTFYPGLTAYSARASG